MKCIQCMRARAVIVLFRLDPAALSERAKKSSSGKHGVRRPKNGGGLCANSLTRDVICSTAPNVAFTVKTCHVRCTICDHCRWQSKATS